MIVDVLPNTQQGSLVITVLHLKELRPDLCYGQIELGRYPWSSLYEDRGCIRHSRAGKSKLLNFEGAVSQAAPDATPEWISVLVILSLLPLLPDLHQKRFPTDLYESYAYASYNIRTGYLITGV